MKALAMKALTDALIGKVDAFLKESFSAEQCDGGDEAEIAICEAIEVIIRRRRNQRLVFSRLPSDIIHCVFSLALDLDRIHEPDLPLDVLDDHRKQLFRMRCVSVTWNEFLVSGPRYWPAVNLRTPPDILKTNIRRAAEAPLCIYSTNPKERRRETTPDPLDELVLLAFMAQVRTIRSHNEEFLPLWKGLLQCSMSMLETLDVTEHSSWDTMSSPSPAEWLSGTMPMIRNIMARGWQPQSNAAWLGSLKSLVFSRPTIADMNMLRILSQCSSLSSLRIEVDGWDLDEEEPTDSYPNIVLPNLRKLELEFDVLQGVLPLVRRLHIPHSAQRSLNIMFAPQSEEDVEDLVHFIFPEGTVSKLPTNPLLQIHNFSRHPLRVTYTAGARSITFPVPDRFEEWDLLENIIIVIQNRLNNPPFAVELDSSTNIQASTLRRLGNLNIQRIRAKCLEGHFDNFLAAIGSRHETLPSGGTVGDDHNWPFESLRELTIERTDFPHIQLARLVGIRRGHLRTTSKEWLKLITLIECNLRGMYLSSTILQLRNMGVTLVAEGCREPDQK